MRRFHGVGVLLLLLVASLPGIAQSAGTISGKVTHDGTAVVGAVVTVAAPDQSPKAVTTGADGRYSVDVGGSGPYSVGVQAAGMAAHSAGAIQPGTPHDVAVDTATYAPLPIYAGSALRTAADARTGIFYTIMRDAPELYRTVDHGGTWQPVPMRYEDPDTGLNRVGNPPDLLVTSAVSGEVAVALQSRASIHFSTDYGLTWRTIGGIPPPPPGPSGVPQRAFHFFFWDHASLSSQNVILVARRDASGNWTAWRANPAAADPAFVQVPGNPFTQGSLVAGAHAGDGAFLGQVSPAGELSFARLTASGDITFGPGASGLPTPPVLLRLGGAKNASGPPDGALVVGGTGAPYTAQMLTKSGGAPFEASEASPVPSDCRFLEGLFDEPTGSVAPTATGASGSGTVGQCWVTKTGTGPGSLTYHDRCCGGSRVLGDAQDVSYDAEWGPAGNRVILRAGAAGPAKSARLDLNGVPDFFSSGQPARPGTDPTSGGASVNGIVSPPVFDTDYGPSQADLAIAGGTLAIASRDGGSSFGPVVSGGHAAVNAQWWQGGSGEWLVFGHGGGFGGRNLLSAVLNWNGAALIGPNVTGSRSEDLGGPPDPDPRTGGYTVTSLRGVPGTDTVFIGLDQHGPWKPALYRARIVPGTPPSLADVFSFDGALAAAGATLYLPNALAYCSSSDVLFAATGSYEGDYRGSLLRITGARTTNPGVTVVASIPNGTARTVLQDVRADCAAGVVYAAGLHNGALYKSTDAGLTFSSRPTPAAGGFLGGEITAIGLNPADDKDVKIASGFGLVAQSTNGCPPADGCGWTLISDPEVNRPIRVSDIEFPPVGPGPHAVGLSAAMPRPALVGTSSGAFQAELAVTRGVIGVTANAGGTGRTQAQITSLRTDSNPAAVVAATGSASAVFRRSNGLYYVSTTGGSWSLPTQIPGTARSDFPAAARDPGGGLNVVFTRTGAAPGIYVVRRDAKGVWSAPRRLSSGAGDTLPAIVMPAPGAGHVAFLRTRGRARARGIYYASSRSGRWTRPSKVRGTGVADASPALGGPALDAFAGRVHLAFARARQKRGIYYTARRGSRWSVPRRLTRSSDVQPALAVDLKGARHIVFRRASGKRRGLFALRGARKWSLTRIAGTTARDGEPALSLSTSGATIILAFARPSGSVPGVYYDARGLNGRWLPKPRRWSTSAKDRNPSVHSDFRGRLTIVFDRG